MRIIVVMFQRLKQFFRQKVTSLNIVLPQFCQRQQAACTPSSSYATSNNIKHQQKVSRGCCKEFESKPEQV